MDARAHARVFPLVLLRARTQGRGIDGSISVGEDCFVRSIASVFTSATPLFEPSGLAPLLMCREGQLICARGVGCRATVDSFESSSGRKASAWCTATALRQVRGEDGLFFRLAR